MTKPVSVFSEFQPLEEMIVGRTYPPEAFELVEDIELRQMLQRIAHETEEDCQSLAQILESHGVRVRRPEILFDLFEQGHHKTKLKMLKAGLWETGYPNPPLAPRDLNLALGDQILSLYSRTTNRWLESQAFATLFMEYYKQGAKWISMPPPILSDSATSYADYEGKALLYHAACFVKCGRDIFHTPPGGAVKGGRGTREGLRWIKENLNGDYRFHEVQARPGHLDGKIAFLKPGLILSWLPKEELPDILRSWDMIPLYSKSPLPEEFQRLRGKRYYKEFVQKWLTEWIGYVDETYFDVNIISINENLVVLNGENPRLIKELKNYGIDAIPFNFRHRYFWDGGLHCLTLDIRRKGPCEDYFS